MTYEEIYDKLRELAPNVLFSANRELDSHLSWDGDGPSPREEGFSPYDVQVTAAAIINGCLIEADVHLGDSWYMDDEPLGDIHGYLPQMLKKVALELWERLTDDKIKKQLVAVRRFLHQEMNDLWQAQQDEKQGVSS